MPEAVHDPEVIVIVPEVALVIVTSVEATEAVLTVNVPPVLTVNAPTVKIAAPVAVIVEDSVTEPDSNVPVEMVIVPAACVTAPPLTLKSFVPIAMVPMVEAVESKEAIVAFTSTVTVPTPELASKNTPLDALGAVPWLAPPLVEAQCDPSDQLPPPPTQ